MAERMVLATGNDAKLGGGTLKNYHIHFKKLKVCVAAAADEHRAMHGFMIIRIPPHACRPGRTSQGTTWTSA